MPDRQNGLGGVAKTQIARVHWLEFKSLEFCLLESIWLVIFLIRVGLARIHLARVLFSGTFLAKVARIHMARINYFSGITKGSTPNRSQKMVRLKLKIK